MVLINWWASTYLPDAGESTGNENDLSSQILTENEVKEGGEELEKVMGWSKKAEGKN